MTRIRLPPNAVAQLPGEGDEDRGEQHGEQHDGGRGALGESEDVGEVHGDVDGADVGADGLHGGDQDDLEQRCPVVREQVLDGFVVGVALGLGRDEFGAVLDLQAEVEAQRAERQGEQERDPPAPGFHGRAGQGERDEGGDAGGQGLAELGDAGDEGDVQRAALGRCPFPDVAGGAADLAAGGEALQDPHQHQQDRRPHADLGVPGEQSGDEPGQTHQSHAGDQAGPAALAVTEPAEEDRADRADHERGAEHQQRVQQAHRRVVGGEEHHRQRRGHVAVDAEVVVLDEGAEDGDQRRLLGLLDPLR